MKIISIRHPWLEVILSEGKNIENRSKNSHYRGWVALHAPSNISEDDELPNNWTREEALALKRRAIIGVARIVDVVTESSSKWFNRRRTPNFGLVLSDVTRLKSPMPYDKGVQGIRHLPEVIANKIKRIAPKLKIEDE